MKKKLIMATMLIGLALCIPTHAHASTGTAKSQVQLEKMLTDRSVDIIKISTSKKTTLIIPSGSYNKKLIINAPNVRLTNNGKFSDVTIKNLTKYTEKAKGNSLNITDDKLSVNVSKSASLKNVTLSNEKLKLHLVVDGNVNKLTINAAKVVGIHGKHTKPISIESNSVNTKINISSLVTFDTKDMQNESSPTTDMTRANIEDNKDASENTKADIDAELELVKQQAYNKAYSDWLNYFITQSQTVNKNAQTNTNTQQTDNKVNNQTSNEIPFPTTPSAIISTEESDKSVEEPIVEPEEPSEPVVTYQMTFTHWDNPNAFNTYTGRSQYVYISNTEDSATPLEGTDWQVAIVSNNEMATDASLIWSNLIDATGISGVIDSTYYQNAYKLTFNENGVYYLRAKYNDQYVYSMPIVVYTDNTIYLETEIDGKTYMTQAQVSKINATFKYTGCTPEEILTLENVTYIKYKNSSTLHRGLYVSHIKTDLNAYTIYYKFNKSDEYNPNGDLFQTTTYTDDYMPLQTDSFTDGVLIRSRVNTYDEFGRTYSVVTINYNADGSVKSKSGYYYTYDEDGNSTKHNGLPPA